MDLNKHIVKNIHNNNFHSSGIARTDDSSRIGSVSKVSFNQRQEIDSNRTKIGRYRESILGSARNRLRNSTYSPLKPRSESTNKSGDIQRFNSVDKPIKHQFVEPPSRKFNP